MQDSNADQSFLHHLSAQHMQDLVARGTVRSYPRNVIIVNEGDRGDGLYIVLSGKVRAYLADENGKEVDLETLGPGGYFGEMVLDGGPRSASVITCEPSRFSVVSLDQFRGFLRDNPDAAGQLIHALVARIRRLTRVVGDLALLDVYGRVARTLLDLAADQDGVLVIPTRLTQQEIANRVGASREMVSRILKELRAGGYIREEAGRTVILRKPPARW